MQGGKTFCISTYALELINSTHIFSKKALCSILLAVFKSWANAKQWANMVVFNKDHLNLVI